MTKELLERLDALARDCERSEGREDQMAAVVLFALAGAAEVELAESLAGHTMPFTLQMRALLRETLNSRN